MMKCLDLALEGLVHDLKLLVRECLELLYPDSYSRSHSLIQPCDQRLCALVVEYVLPHQLIEILDWKVRKGSQL